MKPAVIAAAVAVGAGVGISVAILQSGGSSTASQVPAGAPNVTWPARTRLAPNFRLRDENGAPITLRSLRGHPVIITFIDPVCRNLCPLEAKVLNDVPHQLPEASRPTIVAVSVNPWADTPLNFRLDADRWHLVPEWRWALGGYARLADVWRRYFIGVQVRKKTLAGITVHEVDHTEAAYVIDAAGYERALFVFPYRSSEVVKTVRALS